MNGIALTVLVSQLPKMFGISIEHAGPVRDIWILVRDIVAGKVNWTAWAVGAGTMAIIVALKPFRRIPGVLIAVAAATVTVGLFSLETTAGLKVLGHLAGGLPPFAMPWPGGDHLGTIFVGGCTVALVAVADTSVLSRTFAAKTTTTVDPNTEIIALGAANVGAALFQGFPISSSSSRTPVAADAGAKTQLAGVVGVAAVVITSAIGLIEIAGLRRIFRVQRSEFWLSVACFVGVAVLGAIPGIGLAIVIAVGQFLWDAWRPHYAVMGRVDGVRGYHDLKRYPDARLVPGLVLFRWDAPLFFANAELFQQRILEAVAASPTPVRRVIVAAEPVTDVDVTAGDMLTELHRKLRHAGIELRFAEMKDPVKDQLKRLELLQHLGSDVFHPTVGAAIDSYLAEHHVAWEP
jgi:MFS superfamily sulfate permease-like transporter